MRKANEKQCKADSQKRRRAEEKECAQADQQRGHTAVPNSSYPAALSDRTSSPARRTRKKQRVNSRHQHANEDRTQAHAHTSTAAAGRASALAAVGLVRSNDELPPHQYHVFGSHPSQQAPLWHQRQLHQQPMHLQAFILNPPDLPSPDPTPYAAAAVASPGHGQTGGSPSNLDWEADALSPLMPDFLNSSV